MSGVDTAQLLKKSLFEIKRLKREAEEGANRVPVAIIGMACRLPGGSETPEKYWDLLKNGREGLTDVPEGRWNADEFYDEEPGKPLKIYTKQLNFLAEDVSLFDARLFVISPREAEEMDPQQRLLLELTWEALERAGIAPKSLKEQPVGVFMGIITSEYALLPRDMATTGPHTMTGLLNSMAAGRIAFAFGFHGPALSIDTACSSSLVSIHQACKSIQENECQMAVAGGAGLMLSPLPMLNLCKLHALSKDGRCKTFSADGDGYGRGEGAGVVVLKRLDLAQRDGDPILAVIEASNLNHDGPSSGLTVPNGQAQRKLLEETLTRAGIAPHELGYVEMHGTGTSLGDPIEFQALVDVFGKDRGPDNPLMLGTCKANIGHLEAAAGIASVIKTVLCLQNEALPPHINCAELNPRINLQRIPALLPDACTPWTAGGDQVRRVGISSFGFSGTNAFMIIREPPPKTRRVDNTAPDRKRHILALSAQSKAALSELAKRYRDDVSGLSGTDLPSFAYTVNVGRTHFSWRAGCVWSSKAELLACLSGIETQQDAGDGIHYKQSAADTEKRVSVIFPQTLSGALGGLVSVIELCPAFKTPWAACEQVWSGYINGSLLRLLANTDDSARLAPMEKAALVFSVSYGLFEMFRALGVKVSTVHGQGDGVFAMAAATGMVPLEHAVAGLSRRYDNPGNGELLMQGCTFTMPQYRVVLPGSRQALKRSQLADPSLLECAYSQAVDWADIWPLFGGDDALIVTLDAADSRERQPGRSERPDHQPGTLGTLSWDGVVHFLAECYSQGHQIDWKLFDEGLPREKRVCPTYPFQRRAYWLDVSPDSLAQNVVQGEVVEEQPVNPLVGALKDSPLEASEVLFTIGPGTLPGLGDTHYIVHIGYFLEMLASGALLLGKPELHLAFLTFDAALIVPEGEERDVHLVLDTPPGDESKFSFHSPGPREGDWTQNIHGVLGAHSFITEALGAQTFAAIKSGCDTEMSGDAFYQAMRDRGFVLGNTVQWIDQVWCRDGEAFARFRPATPEESGSDYGLGVHPGVWASCFQLLHATLDASVGMDVRFVLVGLGAIDIFRRDFSPTVWCHVTTPGHANEEGVLDGVLTLYTETGEILAVCQGCEMKAQAVEKEEHKHPGQGNPEIVRALCAADVPEQQLALIVRYLKNILGGLLKIPEDEIVASESINQLGMDSMVGFELRDKIEKEFGVPVPIPVLMQGPTPVELAEAVQQDFKALPDDEQVQNTPSDAAGSTVLPAYSDISKDKQKWVRSRSNAGAGINLYCLPYGGGGASLYRNWGERLPNHINVCPIQLPGRQERIAERPVESMVEMVQVLTDVLGDELSEPYAIYGHSAGALVAYAWTQYLAECDGPMPRHLIVGGCTAPYIYSPYMGVIQNVFQECGFDGIPSVDELVEQSGRKPEEIKQCMAKVVEVTGITLDNGTKNQSLPGLLLPQLVADSKLVESFDARGVVPVNVPIAALHGVNDDRVTVMGMRAWKSLTTASFTLENFSGDHFFLHADQCEKALTAYIAGLLERYRREVVLSAG